VVQDSCIQSVTGHVAADEWKPQEQLQRCWLKGHTQEEELNLLGLHFSSMLKILLINIS